MNVVLRELLASEAVLAYNQLTIQFLKSKNKIQQQRKKRNYDMYNQ